jgi:hypothetical protein
MSSGEQSGYMNQRLARTVLFAVPCALLLVFASSAAYGQGAKGDFPDSLFGVKLGSVHSLGQSEKHTDVGTLPIRAFRGVNQFLGRGIHYYFQPRQEYTAFKYIEKRKKPDDQYFATSFRLYLLPVIPKTVSSVKDLEPDLLKWEVALIEWSEESEKDKDRAYYWAIDFCRSLEVDLGRKADVFDHYESKWYSCTFKDKDSELKADSLGGTKTFTLKYAKTVFERKDNAIDTVLRKLQMNEIRPYR